MTEKLQLQPNDKVLEIGTGSGFQTAVLAQLAKEVYTIEFYPELPEKKKKKRKWKSVTIDTKVKKD